MQASRLALLAGRGPPSLDAAEAALAAFSSEIDALRREGFTRSLSSDAAECFFALGFALEQMRKNFKDLERCVAEWAGSAKDARRSDGRPE